MAPLAGRANLLPAINAGIASSGIITTMASIVCPPSPSASTAAKSRSSYRQYLNASVGGNSKCAAVSSAGAGRGGCRAEAKRAAACRRRRGGPYLARPSASPTKSIVRANLAWKQASYR